jgi:hypothetical protein
MSSLDPSALTMNGQKIEFFKRTGIICTIGPASNTVDTLVNLFKSGMGTFLFFLVLLD